MGEYQEILERIAAALETIAAGKSPRPRKSSQRISRRKGGASKENDLMRGLIATYCEAFKARYGINPIVDGKTAGLAGQVLSSVTWDRAKQLVEAYLQMEDRWFLTRTHDFPTFVGNLGKVAVSLAAGTSDPHEKRYWERVFGGEPGDESRGLYGANEKPPGGLGEFQLLSSGDETPMESV